MKQSEIQVGKEYTISNHIVEDEVYFARYSKLGKSWFTITAKVLEVGVERVFSQRKDGVRIEITGEALTELRDRYMLDHENRKNDFVISNRQVLESVETIAQAQAEAEAKREQEQREYETAQAAKGAELDPAMLARFERSTHENAGDELQRVRDALGSAILNAQELLSYVQDAERPRGYNESTWTAELPEIRPWRVNQLAEVPAAIATYNAAAKHHNMFAAAREAGQFERIED